MSPSQPTPTDFRLAWRSPDGQQRSVPLTAPELKIGKASDCELILTDNAYVSRKHARITRRDGQLMLEDLNSSNGTFLRINKPTKVEPGNEIIVGTTVLRVESSGA
jgi:pSer/pThr/pTyr-binding forkhead associated (FHA) protein